MCSPAGRVTAFATWRTRTSTGARACPAFGPGWIDRVWSGSASAYFGTADPEYYGIRGRYLWGTTVPGVAPADLGPPELPGFVAVSVTLLDGVPFDAATRDFYKSLRDREPAATIGSSIRVYKVDRPWW